MISVPLLNGETVLVPFRKIGISHASMFRGSASVAATPSHVPETTRPKRKRPEEPLAEMDKRKMSELLKLIEKGNMNYGQKKRTKIQR